MMLLKKQKNKFQKMKSKTQNSQKFKFNKLVNYLQKQNKILKNINMKPVF